MWILAKKDGPQQALPPDHYPGAPPALAKHPLFGHEPVGLMSGDAPREQVHAPIGGHEGLVQELHRMGLQHEATDGSYGGPERSVIIHKPTLAQMFHLGHRFGQEAVVYGQHGQHQLLYTTGQHSGLYHPMLPRVRFSGEAPPDYYTRVPGHGFLTLYFDQDKLLPSGMQVFRHSMPMQKHDAYEVPEQRRQAPGHPHAYAWHEGDHRRHPRVVGPGLLISGSQALRKAFDWRSLRKADYDGGTAQAQNEQASVAGTSKEYGRFAAPYGKIDKQVTPNLKFWHGLEHATKPVDDLVAKHGYQVHYAGGKHGRPDLANKNYTTGHLMIWDPSSGSGGDFGHEAYTNNWRRTHELAHALTHKDVNQIYGEGGRMGRLGKHRTLREAKRAVHWEWMVMHKQRELNAHVGVHVSDEDFHRDLNTTLHDAVHRAVTGKFTEPADEGFHPHSHKVSLETALGMVDEAGKQMGLHGPDHLLG